MSANQLGMVGVVSYSSYGDVSWLEAVRGGVSCLTDWLQVSVVFEPALSAVLEAVREVSAVLEVGREVSAVLEVKIDSTDFFLNHIANPSKM